MFVVCEIPHCEYPYQLNLSVKRLAIPFTPLSAYITQCRIPFPGFPASNQSKLRIKTWPTSASFWESSWPQEGFPSDQPKMLNCYTPTTTVCTQLKAKSFMRLLVNVFISNFPFPFPFAQVCV